MEKARYAHAQVNNVILSYCESNPHFKTHDVNL